MGSASAILGPLCDGLHSQYGVLEYAAPITPFQAVHWDFETTWWTPLLFALAGIILGVSHPILDANFPESKPRGGTDPSWTFVLTAIAGFVLQYFLSAKGAAVLDSYMLPDGNIVLDVVLAATALAHWAVFDATKQGLFMAALTAVAGPAVEVLLIKQGLYAYAHPQLFGAIPTWIAWVYFCGSPAVGSLGRKVAAELTAMQRLS